MANVNPETKCIKQRKSNIVWAQILFRNEMIRAKQTIIFKERTKHVYSNVPNFGQFEESKISLLALANLIESEAGTRGQS